MRRSTNTKGRTPSMHTAKELLANEKPKLYIAVITTILILLIMICYVFRSTVPVGDGDLWFHLSYGKYFIENKTLIPDHTIYTWLPGDNSMIYCAWIPELFFYILHVNFGMSSLFVLQYLCVSIFLFLFLLAAYRFRVHSSPLTWFICLIGFLLSLAACQLKPEVLSFVYFTAIVALWYYIKAVIARGAVNSWRLFYLFPFIMLFWVNSHGAFIFGIPFLVILVIGDTINHFFKSPHAIPSYLRKHLWISVILCGASVFITPYGYHYPLQIISSADPAYINMLKAINAYSNIFSEPYSFYRDGLFDIFFLAIFSYLILFVLSFKKKNIDFVSTLLLPCYCIIYMLFLRTTYFLAPVYSFSALWLISWQVPESTRNLKYFIPPILIISLLLTVRVVITAIYFPQKSSFFGTGLSYYNPEEETLFIKNYITEDRIGNSYNAGSYLIWKLWPGKKAMIDTRWFPFVRQEMFLKGQKLLSEYNFKEFLDLSSCKVWCLEYCEGGKVCSGLINTLIHSDRWKLAFYGNSAAVFVRDDITIPCDAPNHTSSWNSNKNVVQLYRALDFSIRIYDWDSAYKIIDAINNNFSNVFNRKNNIAASSFLKGMESFSNNRFEDAIIHLEQCNNTIFSAERTLLMSYQRATVAAWKTNRETEAYRYAKKSIKLNPNDLYGLFNSGVIGWWLNSRYGDKQSEKYTNSTDGVDPYGRNSDLRFDLIRFITIASKLPGSKSAIEMAQSILNNKLTEKPVIIEPKENESTHSYSNIRARTICL